MQEISFINLSKEKSKGLHQHIYNNAVRLQKDSQTLAKINESYASASSLLILSSEEIIKSILVLLHSKGFRVYLLKDANRFFKDHVIRHNLQLFIETGMSLFQGLEKWDKRESERSLPVTSKNWLNKFLEFTSDALLVISEASQTISRINDILKFNDQKNAGFYVDYKNKILNPNEIISQKDYDSIVLIHARLKTFYKQLRIFFHPSITKHLSKKEINKIEEGLHLFINDGLKEVSIKNIHKIN
ncbi:hypothetical protein GCM10011344_26820 [Dokdonia pacifica]|uniref:Abortive infection protein, AbiV family n=1 Tax=Dokdonia pacifica TaxID=1627892 RepID=A0A239DYV5_9FLAO|nr:AbiV family abortive infection protein [Dokdonia pacifica]GGG24781.1 hypothetical protein GCM10011344_26820 [Dokdonia pacifica]SNS37646.1 abortive infection protein, AbiV family [Dokdonia pacifica]